MAKLILIAVDLQKDFIDGALGTREAEAIVPAAASRIRELREAGAGIFATLDTHEKDYMQTREGRKLPVPHCIRGTVGWEISPALTPAADALIFDKPTFGSTELMNWAVKEHAADPIGKIPDRTVHGHLRDLQRHAAEGRAA